MKRPNAIKFMTLGGLVAGAVLGLIYPIVILVISLLDRTVPASGNEMFMPSSGDQWVQVIGTIVMIGILIGASTGLVLGFLSGFAMDWQVRRLTFPLDTAEIKHFRVQVRWIVVIIAGIGAFLAFYTVISMTYFVVGVMTVGVPTFISLITAYWGAERYINKLTHWNKLKRN